MSHLLVDRSWTSGHGKAAGMLLVGQDGHRVAVNSVRQQTVKGIESDLEVETVNEAVHWWWC